MSPQFFRAALAAGHATVLVKLADWSGPQAIHPYPLKWIAGIAICAVIGLALAFRSFDAQQYRPWDERMSLGLLAGIVTFWLTALLQTADVLPSTREVREMLAPYF